LAFLAILGRILSAHSRGLCSYTGFGLWQRAHLPAET
jgi:hypothetical protein